MDTAYLAVVALVQRLHRQFLEVVKLELSLKSPGAISRSLSAPRIAPCTEFHRELNRHRSERNAELEVQCTELAKIERRTRKLVELITEDDAPVKALKAELRALEERQAALESALAVSTAPAPLIHPNLAEIYRQKVAALHEALTNPASRDEAFDTIRSLIEEIRLVPLDGELRIEIKGELGGILSLCEATGARKPGREGRAVAAAEQIKMVAGTRNQWQLS